MSAPEFDSLVVAQEVDALCHRYEDALRRGTAGLLDGWLPAEGAARAAALVELACLEFEYRVRGGEAVGAADYFNRYPELRADAALAARLLAAERRLRSAALPATEPDETVSAATSPFPGPASRPLPEDFGRYRILKVLGQGGMGIVYQAHDTQLDRQVALKVMRFGTDDPQQVERFFREARIAAAFTHPNLCPVYDAGQRQGIHYLTMPLLGGESLAAHLRREGHLPEKAAAALAAQIARAVHEAHRAGVLHRDLKPANVMLNERRQPVVMDFGMARRVGPLDPRSTAPGMLVGTPAYMAPERIDGDSDQSGPTQDVYSLGVVLYEMLTAQLPFDGTVSEILKQVLTRSPEPPSRYRPDLDPGLERVCLTALAKDPKDRHPSMEAFAERLEACLTADEPGRQPPRRGSRHPLALIALLVGLVTASLGGASLLAWYLHAPAAVVASTPATVAAPTDLFQAGSEWRGKYTWVGDPSNGGTAKVDITWRDGDRFRAVYSTTEGRDFSWDVEGTVKGTTVEWKFTANRLDNQPPEVVEKAKVEGALAGKHLDARYRDSNSQAVLTLDWVK
jgi:hypothetical protein